MCGIDGVPVPSELERAVVDRHRGAAVAARQRERARRPRSGSTCSSSVLSDGRADDRVLAHRSARARAEPRLANVPLSTCGGFGHWPGRSGRAAARRPRSGRCRRRRCSRTTVPSAGHAPDVRRIGQRVAVDADRTPGQPRWCSRMRATAARRRRRRKTPPVSYCRRERPVAGYWRRPSRFATIAGHRRQPFESRTRAVADLQRRAADDPVDVGWPRLLGRSSPSACACAAAGASSASATATMNARVTRTCRACRPPPSSAWSAPAACGTGS